MLTVQNSTAIRSGDYYMFEEFDDDLLDLSLEAPRATVEDVDDEGDENKVTVSKVWNAFECLKGKKI